MKTLSLFKKREESPLALFSNLNNLFFDDDFLKNRSIFKNTFFDEELFSPSVNIKNNKSSIELELSLPGYNKEDVEISVDDKILTISSEKKKENVEKNDDKSYIRKEFSYSSFKKTFDISDNINEDGIVSNFENGVLKITLPKLKEETKKEKRLISIN